MAPFAMTAPSMKASGARATQAAHVNRVLRPRGARGASGSPSPLAPPQLGGHRHPSVQGNVKRALSEVGMRMIFG